MAIEQVNFLDLVGPAAQIDAFRDLIIENYNKEDGKDWFDVRKWGVHRNELDLTTEGMNYSLIEFEDGGLPIIKNLKNGQKWLQMNFITRDGTMNETFLKALSQKFQALVVLGFYNWEMMQSITTRLAHNNYYDEEERDFDTDEERFEELVEKEADAVEFADWSEEMIGAIETQIKFEKERLLEEYYQQHPEPIIFPTANDLITNIKGQNR